MASPLKNVSIYTNSGHTLTPLENAFISAYLIHKNGARAVSEAGYKIKNPRQQESGWQRGKRKEEKHECNISSIRYNTTYNNR